MSPHQMQPYMNVPPEPAQDDNPIPPPEIEGPDVVREAAGRGENPPQEPAQAETDPAARAQAEMEDMRLRMAAEMDNFKKRLTREHQEQVRFAAEKVLGDLLPALDNLDLAIQYGSTHEACKDMMQGIELTRKQLLDAVEKSGLLSLGVKGEDFDPAVHEAIGYDDDPEVESGKVAKILQRGYKLHDRLLRPAKVMIKN